MSSKKPASSSPATPKNLSEKQLRRIWQELKPQQFFERLRGLEPTARWSLSGSRISGLCPFHQDGTPSFNIYLDRGYAKCFGCETFIWNPLELWAKLKKCGFNDALQDLKQQFGLKFLAASVQNQLNAWERNQRLKRRIMQICHDELINAINAPEDSRYAYAKDAVSWLLNTRQLPSDAIPTLDLLGVLPAAARIYDTLDADAAAENARLEADAALTGTKPQKVTSLTPDAKTYLEGLQAWVGGVVFRYDVAPDAIGQLKLRRPHTKDIRYITDEYEEELGFFGLGWGMYKPLLTTGSQAKYVEGVYLVEGEFDALSVMARQACEGGPTFVIVGAGGSGTVRALDDLRHAGFAKIYLVGDRDEGGVNNVRGWLPNVKHLRAFIFRGFDQFPGQTHDPDGVVVTIGLDAFAKVLLDTENPKLFQSPPDWVYEQALPDVAAVPVEDARGRIEAASIWGQLLKNTIELDLFVESCAKGLNLPAAQLKREIVAREEDEPAFIVRIADVLQTVFYPMGQSSNDNDRHLYLWHKGRREIIKISLADDSSIERELGNKLGPAWQFFQDKVGLPAFLEVPEVTKEQGKYLQRLDKDCRFYYRQALTIISQNTPDFDTAEHKGQGIHVDRDPNGGPPTVYAVNGRDVYRGTYDSADVLRFDKLAGPSLDGIVFDVGIHRAEDRWLTRVQEAADLERGRGVDPASLWDRLHPVLDIGWTFKNHALAVEFLTAHLLATTINNAFRRQVVVSFQADTSAGKSKLNLGLIAGTEVERLHLIEAAVGMQSFTPAGIRSTMNHKVRPLCLDEFENDGDSADKKGRYVQETLDMFRNLTGERNTFTMGSRTGDSKVYDIRMFVFLSAINPPRKVQDANRMIVVNMDKKIGRHAPEDAILQEFGTNYMEALKYDLSVGMVPHIWRIQKLYDEIEFEFGKAQAKPQGVDQRYFQALFPAMSVMKLLGRDYRRWALDFCAATTTAASGGGDNADSAQLYYTVMQSGEISIPGEHGNAKASALQLLAVPSMRDKINISSSGLFFDEQSQLLVVAWTQAIQGVLHKHARYGRETNVYNLREIANRSRYAVKPEELTRSGALARLKPYGLASIPVAMLTAYRVNHIIEALDETPQPQSAATAAPAAERPSDDGDFSVA